MRMLALSLLKNTHEQNPMKEIKNANTRCGAKTRNGSACAKFPVAGKKRCRNHGGLSSGPKSAAGRARIGAAQLKHGKFVNWRQQREREKLYFSKIRRVLNEAEEAGLMPP